MYTLYYSIATRSLRQVHGARHVRACSARCLWRVSGRPTAHLDLWARPSAVLRVTGRSDSTPAQAGHLWAASVRQSEKLRCRSDAVVRVGRQATLQRHPHRRTRRPEAVALRAG